MMLGAQFGCDRFDVYGALYLFCSRYHSVRDFNGLRRLVAKSALSDSAAGICGRFVYSSSSRTAPPANRAAYAQDRFGWAPRIS